MLDKISNSGRITICFSFRVVHKPTGTIMAVKVMLLDVSEEEQKKIISELEILSKVLDSILLSSVLLIKIWGSSLT